MLANDIDVEDDTSELSAELVESAAHGSLTLNSDGTFVYTHDGSNVAEDRFTYRVRDSAGAVSQTAVVAIRVIGVNAAPVAKTIPDQILTLGKSGSVDLADCFSDPDGDPLSYEAQASDASGTVRIRVSGSEMVLIPVAVETTRVTVTAYDPGGLSAEQSFGVTVESVRDTKSRLLETTLAAFGRTVASQTVDAIGERFGASSRTSGANIGGQSLNLDSESDRQGRVERWLEAAAGLLVGRGRHSASRALTGTAAGQAMLGRTGAAGAQTGFASGGGMMGGRGAGGFGSGSLGHAGELSGGQVGRLDLDSLSGRNMMTGSSLQLALGQDNSGVDNQKQGSGWMLWGQGVRSSFSGRPQTDLGSDGLVNTAYLGAERRWGSEALVGVAGSHSFGTVNLSSADASDNELEVGARLTSVHPYVRWSPNRGLDLWALMGYGRGVAELDATDDTVEMGIDLRMAALGLRSDLTRLGAVDLALKVDAFAVSIGSEEVDGLKAVNGDARRVRLMLDGRTDWNLSPNTRLTPNLQLAVRLDGGDAENGIGAELAGGASVVNQRLGLEVEARGHWLMAHQARGFRERGASLAMRFDRGADRSGWALSIAPHWGESGGGAGSLWRSDRMMASGSNRDPSEAVGWRPSRTEADVSYGVRTLSGRGRLEPFARVQMEDTGSPRMGGGLRFNVSNDRDAPAAESADRLQLELLGDYRPGGQAMASRLAAAHGAPRIGPANGSVDYRVGVRLSVRF